MSSTVSRAGRLPASSETARVRWKAAEARLVLTFALLAYAVLAVGYVEKTPIWENPDEPAHFNYIEQVADTGTLPTLQPGDWNTALLERLKTGRLEPGDSIAAIRYEAWQPPLYYIVAAPVFRLTEGQSMEQQVDALRLFDVLLGGATLVVGYLVASEVLPTTLAVAVPLAMTGVPMFTAISASISADALANLLAALLLLVLLRALRAPRLEARHAAALGALLALGVLSKLALVIFIPLALAIVFYRYRAAQPARAVAALLVTGAVIGLPWMVHQVTSYGLLDPLGTTRHALVTDQPRFPGLSPEYVGSFLTISFHSFWAQFGWMAIVAPDRLYFIWGGVCLVALAGLLMRVIRARTVMRPRRWRADWILLLGTIVGAWLAYIGYNLTFQQPQGRYLFTALAPLAICLVVGWAAWAPRRLRGLMPLSLSLALLALNAYALLRVLGPGFLGATLS